MLRSAQHDSQVVRVWLPLAFATLALCAGLAIALLPQSQLITLGALVVAGIIVVAIFAEPILGIALALIVGPFQPLERVALQLPLDSGQIVLGLTVLAYVFRALATRQSLITNWQSPITLALGAFIAICLLTFFPARDFGDWANECIKWLQMGIVALLVAGERDPRKRAVIIGAILLVGAGQAIYGIIQADVRGFGPREFRVLGSARFRAYGTFEQPNPFGGFMGLVWPVAAALALWYFRFAIFDFRLSTLQSKIENRKLAIIFAIAAATVAALCLYALTASGSRGALLGAGTAALAMLLVLLRHPWRWMGLAALGVFLLIAFNQTDLIPAAIRNQLAALVEDYGSLDVRGAHITPLTFSPIERLAHWQAAVRMAESAPWLGVGFGNYAAAYPEFRLMVWENALGHAHNYYLNIFAETGAIGLLAYLIFWATAIVATWRAARRSPLTTLHAALCIGILGAWAHLTTHHVFDNLYVANMHLLIGAYLGFVIAANAKANATRPDAAPDMPPA
jgi:O-antigen ligase